MMEVEGILDMYLYPSEVKFLNEYKNLKIIPSHMGKNSKKELLEIKNQNLIIKEDLQDLIVL